MILLGLEPFGVEPLIERTWLFLFPLSWSRLDAPCSFKFVWNTTVGQKIVVLISLLVRSELELTRLLFSCLKE